MNRTDYRALLWGAGLASSGLLLVELLGFRLIAATLGHDFALFCGLVYPGAAGLGAALLSGRQSALSSVELSARASHRAALAGAFAAAGGVGITWSSQKVAFANGEASALYVAVALSSFLLPAFFSGAALGLVVRRAVRVAGRVGFAESMGMVIGCALLPGAMRLGAPRAMLAVGLIYAGAAFAFAHAGRAAKPAWAVMWTLPLACVALIAGDVGDPWMNIRTDNGRHSRIERYVWTTQGAIGLRKLERGTAGLHIDRGRRIPLADGRKVGRKPSFDPVDLAYLVDAGRNKGPVLVIGSGGGREIDAAIAYGHPRIDAVEMSHRLVDVHYREGIARRTANVLVRQGQVNVFVNDGRRLADAIGRDYQHIIVMEGARFDQASPRLLSRHQRLFTVEAIRDYLSRLRDDGSLLLRVPHAGIYPVLAAVTEALGSAMEGQVVACASASRGIVLVSPRPYPTPQLVKLTKRCRRSRLKQLFPAPAPRKGQRGREEDIAAQAERSQLLAAAVAPRDDRPFFLPPPAPEELGPELTNSVRALIPPAEEDEDEGVGLPSRARANKLIADEGPVASEAGVAAAGTLGASFLLLLGLLIPAPRSRDESSVVPCPAALRYCFPFLGAALGLCTFSLGDRLLRVCGDGAYAWTLIVPSTLVGLAGGRLWTDALKRSTSRRTVMMALAIGLIWLLLLHVVAAQLSGLGSRPLGLRLVLAGVLMLISGFLLGFPLSAALRYVGQWDRVPVSWAWGQHQLGWGFGLAVAALLVHYVGVSRLWPLGVATFAVGAMLLTLGARKAPSARWYLRRLRRARPPHDQPSAQEGDRVGDASRGEEMPVPAS